MKNHRHEPPSANLTAADYAALERSYIPPALAEQAGIYRVASLEGRDLMGRKDRGDYQGLVFPYKMPGDNYVVTRRLRLDHPSVDSNGKAHRYLTAPGERNRPYFPPCPVQILKDPSIPTIVTEGEKKCLSLWRFSLEADGGTPTWLPVSFPGVWSWRGQIGIKTDSYGARVPEKGPLPELEFIEWSNRKTVILFDANVETNSKVAAAERALAGELARRGAEVWIAELPAAEGVNGCDDYLARFGAAKLTEVIEQARRWDWRRLLLLGEKGHPMSGISNAITALRNAPQWAGVLAFDEFHLQSEARKPTPWGYAGKWDEQCDRLLADWFQHQYVWIGAAGAAEAAETVARDRSFHPVRDYLDSLQWDGIPRIEDWLALYLGVPLTRYSRAAGARWLLSAVARIYNPGCKADHMLIAEGPQGAKKSTAFRVLSQPWFTDDISDLGSKDSQMATLGAWIIELPELDAMSKSEWSRVKAFLSRSTDRFRPPYGRRIIEHARECIFVGTVNHHQYLGDETGGRRFWPVRCGTIDVASLENVRHQLWAEAAFRYHAGEKWWMDTEDLTKAANEEQEIRFQIDAWETLVHQWLEDGHCEITFDKDRQPIRGDEAPVTTANVLTYAINKQAGHWSRSDEIRVGAILRRLEYKLASGRQRPRVYVKEDLPISDIL